MGLGDPPLLPPPLIARMATTATTTTIAPPPTAQIHGGMPPRLDRGTVAPGGRRRFSPVLRAWLARVASSLRLLMKDQDTRQFVRARQVLPAPPPAGRRRRTPPPPRAGRSA